MAIDPVNIINVLKLCQDIHSAISKVQQTLYGNLKKQCEKLERELLMIEQILKDLKDKIDNGNTDPRNSEQGLLDAIQDASKHLKEFLTAVSGVCLKKYQIRKRLKLRKLILAKTESLHEARKWLKTAVACSQWRPLPGHETTDNDINESLQETNEPPTFEEIPGIIQPHDVITFKNQIFILMDGGIYSYNMAGKRIKRYQEDGFKPFAETFLGAFLFVTDKKSRCVIKFDESLNLKKRFGNNYMIEPAGITSCEMENCIYVLTGRKKKSTEVAKFTSDGEYIGCYCTDSLEDPWYIKKSSSGEFFISDFARMAVDVYSYDFSNRLYTVNTYKHCRGMDIGDEGHIYVATRSPGYKARYECIVRYIEPRQNKCVMLEESPKPWFWQNQNKSLDFVRGLHYYRCQDKKFLMVVDPGNERLKVIPL